MIKLLPIGLVVILMVSALVYFRFFRNSADFAGDISPTSLLQTLPQSSSGSTDSRLKAAEDSITILAKKLVSLTQSDTNLEGRVKTLENQVNQLKSSTSQVQTTTQTSATTPAPTSVATKKSPLYIPLSSGGSANDQNWYTIAGYEASIDPADYPGYTSMQLEVSLRLVEPTGTAYARVYNATDNSAVSSSEASTTSSTIVLTSSSGFTLPAGRKTYRMQTKSSNNIEIQLQNARIKVNF